MTGVRADSARSRGREVPSWRRGVGLLLVLWVGLLLPASTRADVLEDLRQGLLERRERLREIQQRINAFRSEITERREEAVTLQGQLRVIESGVVAIRLELDKTKAEVETVEAEQAAVAEEIRRVEEEIRQKKVHIREALRLMQTLESDSLVETFFKYPTLTGALVEARALERLQRRAQDALASIRELRGQLETRATALVDLERELKELRERQEGQQKTLLDQQAAKERLLEITRAQEAEFQKLLSGAAAQQRRANAEIASIEREVRAELERQGLARLGGVGVLDFPVDPLFGISCGFHCPDYPFRNILGPHSGIDIPTHMGTPVRAAADGYVARAYDSGGPGYSYVLVLHGDDLSTVYGHLSSVGVSNSSFISRGQVIGSSGGAPGARGAGLSTGPHVHFEVRKDGIPVNPAAFLP